MYYVYIFLSKKDKQLYIGYTYDLRKRVKQHQEGKVRATKNRLPLRLIHYESYLERNDAKRREKFLKGGKGRAELKIQINDILRKVKYKNL